MAIVLNHTIVPSRDRHAAALFFARIFGLHYEGPPGYFAQIRVNDTLTFDFGDESGFESHHYAFHVSDAEFDAIFARVQAEGIPWGSSPGDLENRRLNDWNGGRGFYFRDPDGHVLELMTRAQ